MIRKFRILFFMLGPALLAAIAVAQPALTVDLQGIDPAQGKLLRVYGASGSGRSGVPVSGGHDVDGDGNQDYAIAYFVASPLGRENAGEVDLVFGDGTISGTVDSAIDQPRLLRIYGDTLTETCGSEISMDDVTGDGLGDLLICRQNFSILPDRIGIGALTILVGGPEVRQYAATLQPVDLRDPPTSLTLVNFYGGYQYDRLGIWARTGDIDGDSIADIVLGADQADFTAFNQGELWIIRGGSHLAVSRTIDLRQFGSTALEGQLARITNSAGVEKEHLGGTCQLADLDGNGRAEVLGAATINRSGAFWIPANVPEADSDQYDPISGFFHGRLYIAWDDTFTSPPWAPGYTFEVHQNPASRTVLTGASYDFSLGEEIHGGLDFDGDGHAELFAGDLVADGSPQHNRPSSGVGFLFYHAARLRGINYTINDSPPAGIEFTRILGPMTAAFGSDTVTQGDFDRDGFPDLMIGNPTDDPLGRTNAGSINVLFGQSGRWPALIDTAPGALPPAGQVRIAQVFGALGDSGGGADGGDILCYSGASGDIDQDGLIDLIVNEMLGNGIAAGAKDTGNLVIISGALLSTIPTERELREHLLGIAPLSGAKLVNADRNIDGTVDVADLLQLLQVD